MADKDHDKFVEGLLEASLKRYRSEEPRAGLENRILANVRGSDHALQPRRWVWALAASAVVLLVAIVVLRFTSRPAPRTATVSPAVQSVTPKVETPKMVAVAPPISSVPRRPGQRPQTTTARLRRPEQFPTPAPMTGQEKLLLLYVQSTPASELAATTTEEPIQDLKISPLAFAPLEIKPLPEAESGEMN